MADSCCQKKGDDLKLLAKRQANVLWIVLGINLIMFFVEFASGIYYQSLALTGDSLDMFGDALAYGSSLYVVSKGMSAKVRASQFKAILRVILGIAFGVNAACRVFFEANPNPTAMGIIGVIALGLNLVCLALLTRHKSDDINFTSVWLCSRNDIIANVSVLAAAGLVAITGTKWPDLVVGGAIAFLFLRSAFFILKESKSILKEVNA